MLIAGISSVVYLILGLALPNFFAVKLLPDGLHILAYPCFLAAIILVPTVKIERTHWLGVGLDLVIMMTATVIAGWFFIFEPLASQNSEESMGRLFAVSNLVLDLLLLCVVTLSFLNNHKPAMRSMIKAMALTLVLLTMADFVAAAFSLGTTYEFRGFKSPAWGVAAGVLILTAIQQNRTNYKEAAIKVPHLDRDRIRMIFPIISTVMIGAFLWITLVNQERFLAYIPFALVSAFFLMSLIVLRQTITARENLRMAEAMKNAKNTAVSASGAKMQFLANVSHDLRTPLNGVLGCAQILQRDKALGAKQKELVRTMQSCAEHLRQLITDLLDLSKLEANELKLILQAFDLRVMLDGLIKTFWLEAQNKGIALELEVKDPFPEWVEGDQKRIHQILGNLLHNAIKFTEKGRVKLRVESERSDVHFTIIDTGCGIMPDRLADLFRPFSVLDEKSLKLEGTGLGLSISHKLAEMMDGSISVESVVGQGTTFQVTIPLSSTEAVVEIQKTVVDYHGRRRRILVVDDKEANLIVLRTMLESIGFIVDTADTGTKSLELAKFARPDVVFLDLMMPGMDGFETARNLHAIYADVPIVAATAHSGEAMNERALEAGFLKIVNKPIELQDLLDSIKKHAELEWVFGVIKPTPEAERKEPAIELITPPPKIDLDDILDLAKRGYVKSLEERAERLIEEKPDFLPFARQVKTMARDFKLVELTNWITEFSEEKQ
jgi:signal transduction histidine kinase/CheY-like chemotaxis protein